MRLLETNQLQFSTADLAFAWLTWVTAKKLVPIWKEHGFEEYKFDEECCNNPFIMLEETENVLLGKHTPSEAFCTLNVVFHQDLATLEMDFTEKMCYAIVCAYESLELTLFGRNSLQKTDMFETADEAVNKRNLDFARLAVKAYTSIDDNEPGVWGDTTFSDVPYKPLVYLVEKRLEFWEWWLTEAIPQAWQLAQETPKL
jgi:hypothetical protein